MDNFDKYTQMRDQGTGVNTVYLTAKSDGLDLAACIRMLRQVFGLSFVEAKEVTVVANKLGKSLSDYQEKMIPNLERVLKENDEDET